MKPLLRHKTSSKSSIHRIRSKKTNQTSSPMHSMINTYSNKQKDTKITTYFSNSKETNGSASNSALKKKDIDIQSLSLIQVSSFDISEETKAFITKVQSNRYNLNYDNQVQQHQPNIQLSLLESFSIREKYHNLLIRKLILPVQYSRLLRQFIELDQSLLSSKNKKQRSILRVSASKEDIMKMLFVFPNCFNILSLTNDYTNIVIEANIEEGILKRSSLKKIRNQRQKQFRNQLLQLVNKEHKEFLNKNKISNFNPFKHNTWHSDFNIEECPELPLISHHLLS